MCVSEGSADNGSLLQREGKVAMLGVSNVMEQADMSCSCFCTDPFSQVLLVLELLDTVYVC